MNTPTNRDQEWYAMAAAGLMLRLGLGMLFFIAALNKLVGPGPAGFARWMLDEFAETYLPAIMIAPFAYVLPYVELLLGAALILGVFTRSALAVTGLLLVALAFGKAVQGDYTVVSANLNYVLMAAAALWFNRRGAAFSVDACRACRCKG